MEASTAIGFQTVLTVSDLGLSHAHWPVSMVTSLMGIRGCVRKCSPSHSRLWGRKLYGVCGCLVAARIVVGGCRVFVYDFLGSFLSLLLRDKQTIEHYKMADSGNNGRHGERSRTGIVLVHVTKMIPPRRL